MKGILGKKLGMTQYFNEAGEIVPVTVVEVTPNYVVQKKLKDKEGYNALQLGFGEKKLTRVNKPMLGHFKKAGDKAFYFLKEIKFDNVDQFEVGQQINVSDVFTEGEIIDVTAISKGKGFQGVMKRHNFKGGRATHGSMFHRAPGSAGSSAFPSRVWKGKRYPGHMGSEKVTVQNLKIEKIISDRNLVLIRGAIPGANNSLVVIKNAIKKSA
ncbi:MAG: 50S ribosomal protein L3 [Proteobacteria bacterium]|nr:50S ribosomal protein L3 [Pseudomonadota bacterium]